MKYLKNYQQHNEGWKSNVVKAGLLGSLLMTTPSSGTDIHNDSTELSEEKSKFKKMEDNIRSLSTRRKEICKDDELNNILNEISDNINSEDSTKFFELFNKLNNHLSTKYNYNITPQEVPQEVDMTVDTFNLVGVLGWLGSILLAICGVPQAWLSYKEKHSDGISWSFLLLWGFGEIFCLGYVYNKLDLPLFVNYAINILIVGVMIYYKINPTRTNDDTKEV
jgi:uncharacterized protein with PQ loop repeat